MATVIGYIVGGLALTDGMIGSLAPRWGFRVWEETLKGYFPEPVDRVAQEYSRLSEPAIRSLGVWEVTLASLILLLASRGRD